ncbi:dTDP-4-dehydrorhamnose reductase [Cytobacillus firmus]|uniref:dTDP-4-dehydrorhamnose reductase n=1 Tax=Cytobacillus firmus TaxID=1399 RepID=A0A800MYV0_CYTFI|nr:dTDP-4-dehydrorhamnose reductase [Cytobacillus firmus]KAF0825003.1 dTDP-4-dehydrorhamnose reductase [Cytobacillus firmus]
MKILITGAKGQLGQDVTEIVEKKSGVKAYPFSRQELDILDEQAVFSVVESIQPDWIFHCAAYTNVEAAEDEGKDLNWKVNKDGSAIISKAAAAFNAQLIYISTDYVFDGTKEEPYRTTDPTNPINEYGKAKLAGELAIRENYPNSYIIRTSWVFGENGKNFVYTMLNLAKKMETLKVVNDQYGRPTYTKDLAAFMLFIAENEIENGIYHFSNQGVATWHDFASEILKNVDVQVLPVNSDEFPQKAKRPQHSVMSLDKVKDTGFNIPTWENALNRFMKNTKSL